MLASSSSGNSSINHDLSLTLSPTNLLQAAEPNNDPLFETKLPETTIMNDINNENAENSNGEEIVDSDEQGAKVN